MMHYSWSYESGIMFSFLFFLRCCHDTIVILILHQVERVCTNRTRSTHGPFAYYVVYPTLPSIEPFLTIIIILVHWVERVCTNHTPVPNGPFAYDVVYAILPSIQPSFIHTMGCCGLEEVYVNTIDATLFSIEPSLSRFYRMCSSW